MSYGTLTYEDVMNIDSVGVITARGGIRLGATGANTLINGNATAIGIGTDFTGSQLGIWEEVRNIWWHWKCNREPWSNKVMVHNSWFYQLL